MSAKTARGAKRKCQNEDCDASFYDLGRETFECPVCGTEFDHEAAARALEPQTSRYPARKQPRDLPIVANPEPSDIDDEAGDIALDDDDAADDSDTETSDVLLVDDEDDDIDGPIEIPVSKDDDES